jgi:RNA-directed DNA polymerase
MSTPMMYGRGKSDEAIVARKLANKVERSAADLVERRAEAKGNARQQSMLWTQCRISMSRALAIACVHRAAMERWDPRWEPYAGKPHVRFCAGGAQQ